MKKIAILTELPKMALTWPPDVLNRVVFSGFPDTNSAFVGSDTVHSLHLVSA